MAEGIYRLVNSSGGKIDSQVPGTLGGFRPKKIYGQLDCWAATAKLPGDAKGRVFFLDEATAIAAGYRPCGKCMTSRYNEWKKGGVKGSAEYPWHKLPSDPSRRAIPK